MSEKTPRSRLTVFQWIGLFILVPSWILQVRLFARDFQGGRGPWELMDFSHFYITSVRILSGAAVYCEKFSVEDISPFSLFLFEGTEPTNPPILATLLAPLALLTPSMAWCVYEALSLLVIVAALMLYMSRLGEQRPKYPRFLLSLILLSGPMISLVGSSAPQGFVLAPLLLAFALADRRPNLSGALLGFGVALKIFPLPLIGFVLFSRRYPMFFSAVISASVCSFAPRLFDPRLDLSEYLRCGGVYVASVLWKYSTNQSLFSLVRSYGYVASNFISLPIRQIDDVLSILARGVWVISGVVVALLLRARRSPLGEYAKPTLSGKHSSAVTGANSRHGFELALALGILCAPIAWPNYFIFIWPYLITRWNTLSFGEKMIIWFSLPVEPVYFLSSESSALSGAGNLASVSTSWLTWVPLTIFVIQFGAIAWRDIRGIQREVG